MAEFRCPHCCVPVYSRPGAVEAACPHCGRQAVVAPRQPPRKEFRRPAGMASGKLLLLAALGIVAVLALWIGAGYFAGSGEPRVTMASGEVRPLGRVATPIRARPIVSRGGRQVMINLALTDAEGGGIRGIELARGKRLPNPEVSIVNASGDVVHRGKLEYG